MTTPPNDWSGLSEELKEIKRVARHEGYEKAVEDFGQSKARLEEQERRLREQRDAWHQIMSDVRKGWSKLTDQPVNWRDEKNNYQTMFGHKYENIGRIGANMPEDMEDFLHALAQIVKMGADFQVLIKEFDKNPIVKAQWDRLLVAMRMTEQ